MAVKLEPQNLQYQQLLNQLQGSGQWYSDMGSGYGYERSAGDLGKWCCECMAINAICNCCCCGGRGIFLLLMKTKCIKTKIPGRIGLSSKFPCSMRQTKEE